MSAWRATLMACFIVLLLPFSSVLAMKVNIGGTSHICVSGSQVFHVNFGDGPVQQCGVMNSTPTSNKDKPSCAAEKAKEQAKGLFVSLRESVFFSRVDFYPLSRDPFDLRIMGSINLNFFHEDQNVHWWRHVRRVACWQIFFFISRMFVEDQGFYEFLNIFICASIFEC